MRTLEEMKIYQDVMIQELQELDRELTEVEWLKLQKLLYSRAILEDIICQG